MSSPRSRSGAALLAVALLLASAVAHAAPQVSLSTARQKAAREGKVLLVDFWASYCLPCRMMDETTFADPAVLDYLREHYVSIKIDVENFDGLAIQQQYQVGSLPTMILFASDGREVDRITGTITAADLLTRLRENNLAAHRAVTPGPAPLHDWSEPFARMSNAYAETALAGAATETAPADVADASDVAAAPDAADALLATDAPRTDDAPAPEVLAQAAPVDPVPTEGERILATAPTLEEALAMTPTHFETLPQSTSSEVSAPPRADYSDLADAPAAPPAEREAGDETTEASPCADIAAQLDADEGKVYSLQAGSFTGEANAVRAAAHLRGVTEMPVSIEVDPSAIVPTYRVLVGRFRAEADAEALREALLPSGVSTITRELAMW